ncbi:MAG: 30S ribosomal protein S7 [Chloroflexi bacterium]|nr:MAG: 30S ribosomal protein S7 [Chloroflexota bacterium]
MPRRARVVKREVPPDPRFGSRTLTRFMNKLMVNGKKSLAERIVYTALDSIERTARRSPVDVFDTALRNATPLLEVKPRRVGGATYQVPVGIKGDRKQSLAMRWLIASARGRGGKSMSEKLASELLDASNNTGATIRKRDETHRMAEANKAFSHYRW